LHRFGAGLALVVLVLSVSLAVACGACAAGMADDRLVVRFRAPLNLAATRSRTGVPTVDALCAAYGVREIRPLTTSGPADTAIAARLGLDRTYVLYFAGPLSPAAAAAFSRDPGVELAEPDSVGGIAWAPNDPFFGLEYALDNTGQDGGTPDADIDAPEAWDIERGRAEVVIAILDSGIDYTHPEFQGQLVMGYDIYNRDDDPKDDHGHGTHVAGIVAAAADNAVGVAGAAPGCKLMPIKVVGRDGKGVASTTPPVTTTAWRSAPPTTAICGLPSPTTGRASPAAPPAWISSQPSPATTSP
jgi:subtilisin family serine protease